MQTCQDGSPLGKLWIAVMDVGRFQCRHSRPSRSSPAALRPVKLSWDNRNELTNGDGLSTVLWLNPRFMQGPKLLQARANLAKMPLATLRPHRMQYRVRKLPTYGSLRFSNRIEAAGRSFCIERLAGANGENLLDHVCHWPGGRGVGPRICKSHGYRTYPK